MALNWLNSNADSVFQNSGAYNPTVIGTELKDIGIFGWQVANFTTQEFTTFAKGINAHFNAITDGIVSIEEAERVNQWYTLGTRTDFKALLPGPDPRLRWYTQNVQELEELEQSANKVRPLGTAGKVLAGVGIALDAGVTIYDGVSHGDSAGVVAYDTTATVIGDAAVLAAPPVAIADAVTLGGVSGSITNAFLAPVDFTKLAISDRFTSADAARMKRRWRRKPLLGAIWDFSEWVVDKVM